MAPMPSSQYSSREELLASAKEWAAHQGYAIVIARSRFNRLWLKCDRGGKYENRRNLEPAQRKRKRGDSRLLGCPFKMLAIVRKDGIWRVQTEIPEHNHGPSEDLSQHPTLRRLTEAQTQKVNDMTDAGNTPAETLEELRKLWPDIKVLTRDIYNARKKYKAQKELVELATGLPEQQPYEDPNGSFPGPTANGRWEWVPDGEEVTNKNKKRKRRTLVELHNLDPQLQQPPPASPSLQQPPLFPGNQVLPNTTHHYLQQLQGPQSSQQGRQNRTAAPGGFEQRNPSHAHHHQTPSFANTTDHRTFNNTDDDPTLLPTNNSHHSVSHLRQQQYPRPPSQQQPRAAIVETAIMSNSSGGSQPLESGVSTGAPMGNSMVVGAAGPKAPHSEQNLLSRIERMEKDQRESKRMIAQILGAVQRTQGGME